MRIANATECVVEAVDRYYAGAKHPTHRISPLHDEEQRADGQRRHQVTSKLVARERRVSDGRLVRIARVRAERRKSMAEAFPADLAADGRLTVKGVRGDHRCHVQKYRHVGVTD